MAQSTWPLATAISFAAWVAPSEYWKNSFGLIPLVRNHAVGISQPDVEPTSANETRRPLPSCGHALMPLPGCRRRSRSRSLAVVLRRRDGRHTGVVVRQHVPPRPHPREVDLLVCEGDRCRPSPSSPQLVLAVQLLGEVGEETARRRASSPTASAAAAHSEAQLLALRDQRSADASETSVTMAAVRNEARVEKGSWSAASALWEVREAEPLGAHVGAGYRKRPCGASVEVSAHRSRPHQAMGRTAEQTVGHRISLASASSAAGRFSRPSDGTPKIARSTPPWRARPGPGSFGGAKKIDTAPTWIAGRPASSLSARGCDRSDSVRPDDRHQPSPNSTTRSNVVARRRR